MKKTILITILLLSVSSLSIGQEYQTTAISDQLKIIQISNNCYRHISYLPTEQWGDVPCNGLIYTNNGKAIVVDTPVQNEQTKELIDWLKEEIKVTVVGFIGTHWHIDCVGGFEEAHKQGIETYTGELTHSVSQKENIVIAKNKFQDSLSVHVGNHVVHCSYLGGGHTPDNIVVWIPEDKILFGGCMVKDIKARNLGNTDYADLEAWPVTLRKVLEKYSDAKIVVPGHGKEGGIELLEHSISLFNQ